MSLFLSTVFLKVKVVFLVRLSSTYRRIHQKKNKRQNSKKEENVREGTFAKKAQNLYFGFVYVSPKTSVRYPLSRAVFIRIFRLFRYNTPFSITYYSSN